jgi:hypothetical protein
MRILSLQPVAYLASKRCLPGFGIRTLSATVRSETRSLQPRTVTRRWDLKLSSRSGRHSNQFELCSPDSREVNHTCWCEILKWEISELMQEQR